MPGHRQELRLGGAVRWLYGDNELGPLDLDARDQCRKRGMVKADLPVIDFCPGLVVSEMLSESGDNRLLDFGSRNTGDRSEICCSALSVEPGLGDIVAIADTALGGMRCDHAMARIVEQQILQQVIGLLPDQGLVGLMG